MERLHRRTIRQILRVNHAGEYGAIRIYAAQMWVAQWRAPERVGFLRETLGHERRHLSLFRELMWPRGAHPCAMLPIWGTGGIILGIFTALFGADAMMVCTEAVERTVHAHLNKQLQWLGTQDETLSDAIRTVRDEEAGHLEDASNQRRSESTFLRLLDGIVAGATTALIWLSTYGALTRMSRNLRAI